MSEYTLVIGNKNYSTWSLRPWIYLRHHDIPFEEIRVALDQPDTDEKLSQYYSDGKVPVLLHGENIVWDSLSILEYLAERHPETSPWPEDAYVRAVARSMSAEMHSSFTALRNALPMNCRREPADYPLTDEVRRDVSRIQALWAYSRKRFGADGPWLCGEYSIVDAMFAPVVLRFITYKVVVNDVVKAYMDTVLADPALQEWIAAGKLETEIIEADEV
ncbi:MAG: glutathione S-transferase family protein [bacterium]